jgi:hypothetical protein
LCAAPEPRSGVRPGDQIALAIDARRPHFFDPEAEATIDEPRAERSSGAETRVRTTAFTGCRRPGSTGECR